MFAIADSASIRCARVMRGTASIASTVTLRAASRSSSSLFCAGQMKLISVAPGFRRSTSCLPPAGADRLPHLEHDVRLGVERRRVRRDGRARLDVGASANVAASPAPASTTTSRPSLRIFWTVSGAAATRDS